MKRRLRLFDPATSPLDESLVIPRSSRGATPTPTLAVVADGGEEVAGLVEAALEVLGDRGCYVNVGVPAAGGAAGSAEVEADDLDRRLAGAFREAGARLVVAVGPELPARLEPTVLVVVTGGRSLARLAPATRLLLGDAHLILREGRAGVGRGLATALLGLGDLDGI